MTTVPEIETEVMTTVQELGFRWWWWWSITTVEMRELCDYGGGGGGGGGGAIRWWINGLGHYARDCLNLKTLAFVPDDVDPIYDTDAEHELDEPGDELVYPDRGEALVIQRALNVAVSKSLDDNSWLRNTVKVSKYCLVQFSIAKNYKDEVWCEVLPMDAAHILLGCPWQFDRKTKHDEFQNTYSFKKDGVNITLVPFDSQENQTISVAPLQVQPLLKEFADVIPDDIPPGLPAIRDI
ncbi:hypothetical protein Tco_0818966 [Tanacetum coccineum]